jgi:hypothetical protein
MASIICGKCKATHSSVNEVKGCYGIIGTVPSAPSAPSAPTAPKPTAPKPIVRLGTFTAVGNGNRPSVTIRIGTHWNDVPSNKFTYVASYLCGRDNESDYAGFAFVDALDGSFTVWRRFRDNVELPLALKTVLSDQPSAGYLYALASSRCWLCGRKLTVPASIHRGLGPVCAEKGF